MTKKAANARRTIKRLEREESQLISKHRKLRDIHEHKQTKSIKRQASNAVGKVDKLAKRVEKLKPVGRGKL